MVKIVLVTFLLVFLSSCHQGSSYISRYGQSIVLNPDQKQTTVGTTETISDQKLTSLVKPNTTPSKVKKPYKDHFKDYNKTPRDRFHFHSIWDPKPPRENITVH